MKIFKNYFSSKFLENKDIKIKSHLLSLSLLLLIITIGFFVFTPEVAHGGGFLDRAGSKLGEAGNAAGVSEEESDLGTLIGSAIRVVLQLLGVIFLVLMVYAGFLWMTSRGQEDKVEKARNIITTTVVGMFIVITAYAITVLITGTIG